MLAASTASAWPSLMPSARCCNEPTPPHAITETGTASEAAHVFDGAHATADCQRNEHLRRHRFDDRQDQIALVGRGGDVEKGEFVCALVIVAAGDFDWVACIAQFDEVDALDHAASRDVETG